jgi:ACS family sodium-dependent inorganic phosphate cotransporter
LGQWQIIFFTTAAVLVLEFVVYTVLASGEEQPWNHFVVQQSELMTDVGRGISSQQGPETEQLDAEKTENA